MKKWMVHGSLVVGMLLVVSATVTYFVIDGTINAMFGGNTPIAHVEVQESSRHYVLTNVSTLSPAADAFFSDQAVRIEDGIITAVGPAGPVSDDVEVVDGQGLFLVPGYTDSHVHLWDSPNDLLLYLANGVTQVREMHGRPHHLEWRREIAAGRLGPDLFVVASQLASFGFWEGLWIEWSSKRNVVGGPEETERAIRALHRRGYDAIKASSFLSRENHAVASRVSLDLDTPFVGHLPMDIDLNDLWTSNQKELAHIEELVKGLNREFGRFTSSNAEAFLDYVRSRRNEVAKHVSESGITVVSTLALTNSFGPQVMNLTSTLTRTELGYVNPGIAEGKAMGWLPGVNRYRIPASLRTGDWQTSQATYWNAYTEAHALVLEALLLNDVPILSGTDANVPVMVPGFSMHQEMKALVNAGMTTAQVLESATRAPGEWMGWPTGQIREGFKANLVLLRDNPLENIDATDEIEMVVINGTRLTRHDLDAMLRAIKDTNETNRTINIEAMRTDH